MEGSSVKGAKMDKQANVGLSALEKLSRNLLWAIIDYDNVFNLRLVSISHLEYLDK